MEYLTQFEHDFKNGNIPIRKNYVEKNNIRTSDVVSDLMNECNLVSSASLPIAKQIAIFERSVSFKIPKMGDLFIGFVHHHVIEKVTFTLCNYTEEFLVDGQLSKLNNVLLWRITSLPIPLLVINDYDNINITVKIIINNSYNLQDNNREFFEACFGYFGSSIKQQMLTIPLYNIPLLNGINKINIVCGIWMIN